MERLNLSSQRVAIAGGGIIGLSIALALVERGHRVSLFDPSEPGRGASWAAAGMLAPAYEAAGQAGCHSALLDACFASRQQWHDWARRLETGCGGDIGLVGAGSLALATTAADDQGLGRMADALDAIGEAAQRLTRADLLRLEPGLGPDVVAGLALTSDGRVDNRAVVTALLRRLASAPGFTLEQTPAPIIDRDGRLTVNDHDTLVVAAGWQSPALIVSRDGQATPLGAIIPELAAIQPVKGQILVVPARAGDQALKRAREKARENESGLDGASATQPARLSPSNTLRHGPVYIVPRRDRVIIGATSEPGQVERRVDDQAIDTLRAAASQLVPDLAARPVLDRWAGIRPATPDHAPLVGAASIPGVWLACGHYRNGILLAPATADAIASSIDVGRPVGLACTFSPERFLPARV